MESDTLENRIRTNIQTAAKKICSRANKQEYRLSKAIIELLERRRSTDSFSAEYSNLNKSIRKHKTKIIHSVIEHNCNMKILKQERLTDNTRIHQIKNKHGEIIREKSGISKVVEATILPPENITVENITNVGSKDIPAFTTDEIQHALSQMKDGCSPGLDEIFGKMLKLAGRSEI
ncbi:hypothetical protein ILUMI_14518 [Ignelater luminosus]|uniref:Uncharacterized protein n=1 Tax=Ignelater luminosus TaxID=2038154 RepID=A0A8K0CYH4_IGNLU|nr:hypothetical protein ILUMI_14518 [Ignelater luminosus]